MSLIGQYSTVNYSRQFKMVKDTLTKLKVVYLNPKGTKEKYLIEKNLVKVFKSCPK